MIDPDVSVGPMIARRARGRIVPPPIKNELDRARSNGGTVENGVGTDLLGPIYQTLERAGEWNSTIFLGASGVREVVSGSVATLFDISGNGNDAVQGTASARPTDTTAPQFGGKSVLQYDGTDDVLDATTGAYTQPNTVIAALNRKGTASTSFDGGRSRGAHIFDASPTDAFAGNYNSVGTHSAGFHTWVGLFNGGSSEFWVDDNSVFTGNLGTNDVQDIILGSNSPKNSFGVDDAGIYLYINADVPDNVRTDITSILERYFN